MSATTASYLTFVPERTPSTHQVLAVIDRGDGSEANTLVGLPGAPSATMLASALQWVLLHQATAERQLSVTLAAGVRHTKIARHAEVTVAEAAILPTPVVAGWETGGQAAPSQLIRCAPVLQLPEAILLTAADGGRDHGYRKPHKPSPRRDPTPGEAIRPPETSSDRWWSATGDRHAGYAAASFDLLM